MQQKTGAQRGAVKRGGYKMKKLFIALMVFCFLAAGCGNSETTPQTEQPEPVSNIGSVTLADANFDDDDEYTEWTECYYIKLNGDSISADGNTQVNGSSATIKSAGVYIISGNLYDGQIIVDAGDDDDVRIVLSGADITCSNSSAVYVKNADKVIISLPEGTQNTLTDGANYVYDDVENEEPSAAIFSKDDIVINGTGALTVNANFNDGIKSNDDIKITGGTLVINSADDGIAGKDMVAVKTAEITVNAEGDGIKSTNSEERGYIIIAQGTFNITAGNDGIQAESSMYIEGGTFKISTGGGSQNSSTGSDWGNWGGKDMRGMKQTAADDSETSESAKALKASQDLTVAGGTFDIDSSDDSMHSNGTLSVSGGTLNIASGDDGIHADTSIAITAGNIDITKSYEGVESAEINISGGNIKVTASDDGINVAGGNDSSAFGRPGENSFNGSQTSYKLNISGGDICVNASGDGVDSNGSIYMSGGTMTVNGPENSGNGALDYQNEFIISGGTLIAVGSSGMTQNTSSDSTQYTIAGTASGNAGSVISLMDSIGNEILSMTAEKQFGHIVVSSPDIKNGETYTIYVDGSSAAQVTVSSMVTTFGSGGTMNGGGMKNNPGGMEKPGGMGQKRQ